MTGFGARVTHRGRTVGLPRFVEAGRSRMEDRSGAHEIPGPRAQPRGDLLMAIANRIVSLHKKFYGKGPTKARAFYQDDLIVVLTRGGFSTGEETLYRAGRGAAGG